MRVHIRMMVVCALLASAAVVGAVAPAAQASFGVTEGNFEAGTCFVNSCTYSSPKGLFYTQAAGHPPWGITTFEVNSKENFITKQHEPEGAVKRIRVDVPPGLAANPEALPKCKRAEFEANTCAAATEVGNTELIVFDGVTDLPISGTVYNLEQTPGLPLLFGIDIGAKPLLHTHLLLEGHVAWNSDFHEYFEINNVPKESEGLKLTTLKSKLNFNGNAGKGNFLTLPSVCSTSTTSYLELESWEGAVSKTPTHTPVGVEGCDKVPFQPAATVTPETAHSDLPDGALIQVKVPQKEGAGEVNTADINDVHLKLPEGMTLNPPAANGLGVCTAAQFGEGKCPASAAVGTVAIETDLPPNSLTGAVYLGSPSGATITGPPFTLYLDAESPAYGVAVRLQGQVTPDPLTGRLETTFLHNPQLPFSELRLKLNGGNGAPVANPLGCATGHAETLFTPYTGLAAWLSSTPFTTDNVGGGACPTPLPFQIAQSTAHSAPNAGAFTAYTFNLERKDGQQFLGRVRTVLPPGLVGLIPSVPLCGEPQAAQGSCPSTSQIGTATATVGAGGAPYPFSGPVYLTGPVAGAPYGLSVPVEAAVGHFDLGRVVTRAAISVDPYSGRVIVDSTLPTIVKGVPLRLKALSVAVTRPSFLLNPTSCEALATESTLFSTFSATDPATSAFQVANCAALPFKPSFEAAGNKLTASRANGMALQVALSQPPQEANIRSVVTQLPVQLPSRLSTLQKACLAATYTANPRSCPPESLVGTVNVNTPVLPGTLSGPAYLVSHGGAAFPDLDLLLEGDGVRVILVGNTDIKNGITTSTFASVPDVPVSSFALTLPAGPHSALTSYGNLCAKPLIMPTTITAQSGAQFKQSTRVSVLGCGVRIVRRRRSGRFLLVTIQTYAPGRVNASGSGVGRASKRLPKPTTTTLKLRISSKALRALRRRHHRVRLTVNVLFVPSSHGEPTVRAGTTMLFRR